MSNASIKGKCLSESEIRGYIDNDQPPVRVGKHVHACPLCLTRVMAARTACAPARQVVDEIVRTGAKIPKAAAKHMRTCLPCYEHFAEVVTAQAMADLGDYEQAYLKLHGAGARIREWAMGVLRNFADLAAEGTRLEYADSECGLATMAEIEHQTFSKGGLRAELSVIGGKLKAEVREAAGPVADVLVLIGTKSKSGFDAVAAARTNARGVAALGPVRKIPAPPPKSRGYQLVLRNVSAPLA